MCYVLIKKQPIDMTTIIYREFEFAASDAKWSIDGHWQRNIVEKKAISLNLRGREALCFMTGDHVMIALAQALQLKVITPSQYTNLNVLYMAEEDFSFEMVILDKRTGGIIVPPTGGAGGSPIANTLDSTGGDFALDYLYYAEKKLKKKRRNRAYTTSMCGCKVAAAVRYACRRDVYSGGRVYKAIWGYSELLYSNVPLFSKVGKKHYCKNLENTLIHIHRRYEERTNMRKAAQASQVASMSSVSRPKKSTATTKATASNAKINQMTTSRAVNYALLFSE